MKEKQKNYLYLCHHCKSCCSTVPVMHRGGNKGDEYNRLFHRLSFPGHLILSSVFRTFPTELMITDCHIILLMVTCLGTCQKFLLTQIYGLKKVFIDSTSNGYYNLFKNSNKKVLLSISCVKYWLNHFENWYFKLLLCCIWFWIFVTDSGRLIVHIP